VPDALQRLFIAVWPPKDVVAELMSLNRIDQPGVRFVRPENWHITLRFLGEADPGEAAEALNRTTLVSAHANLGPKVGVMAKRALVVPVHGLDTLAEVVKKSTSHIGETPRSGFVGHVTLARMKPQVPMPAAVGALISAAFDVEEIALVRSRLEPTGARYETIGTWSFA
jgi:2'-5' RNA ligase